jgi:hypothetical protein
VSTELVISAAITLMLFVGVAVRRRRPLHLRIMQGCIAADAALLLWVETQSSAFGTVAQGAVPAALWLHIGLSALVAVGYVLAILAGFVLTRDLSSRIRGLHQINGLCVLAARSGLLLSTPGLLYELAG